MGHYIRQGYRRKKALQGSRICKAVSSSAQNVTQILWVLQPSLNGVRVFAQPHMLPLNKQNSLLQNGYFTVFYWRGRHVIKQCAYSVGVCKRYIGLEDIESKDT